MENNRAKIKSLRYMLVVIAFLGGCTIYISSNDQSEKFTKIVHMPVTPLTQGAAFQTKTHNGSIEIRGSDVNECTVVATITGSASTMEKAEDVVERTKLSFEQSGEVLVFKIDKPENLVNRSVSVSLDIILPNKVNLDLVSHNGRIEIEDTTGQTIAATHNGKVLVKNVSGVTKLNTHNGKIEAESISGDIDFLSHNGNVEAVFSQAAAADCDITMVTHNGSIDLTAPPNYSARVNISTHNGSIDTDLPVTVTGNFGKNNLTGTISDGQGVLKLETHNGSIKLR